MIDEEVRVENEVAAISLVQKALVNYPYKIVSKVFAWQGSKHGLGWIVQEYLPGEQLSIHFPDLQADKKAVVLDQVAQIFKMIQSFQHGDQGFGGLRIGAENILIDPGTLHITGLLDFDFSHIASPADEYFYSFPSFCGLVPGPFEDEDLQLLRRHQTEGFPSAPSTQEATSESVDWTVARLWQAALEKHNVASPKDIENITELADIYWFLLDVCPPFFNLPRWLARKTEEQKLAAKKAIGENLDR
ncbi:hypothetical protein D6C85_01493 [Aureobasidium pullulans]|uniref:Protein kinase domain-containing protein n=1 Tax=Aureobasidium pullulans TaxID=5580 RepID=A0A4S9XGT5_AURPU|nr:hypothetical protein D6C85_01493 [Aureobasidium pullulans]